MGCTPLARHGLLHRYPSVAVCHHMGLDTAVPRGKRRHGLFGVSRAHLVTKKMEAARRFMHTTHLCISPCLMGALPISGNLTACDNRSWTLGHCHPHAERNCLDLVLGHHQGSVSGSIPSLQLIPASCWSLGYAGTALSGHCMNPTGS